MSSDETSTGGYTDCVSGTFYGFTDTANNEFYPGETLNLQWGTINNGDTPLNITLGRRGGSLVDQIVVDATFSETSSLYQIITNSTANCSLELYSWAIPSNLNTSNPEYQIGLFDGAAFRGTYGIEDYGWISWSPFFYVRDKTSAISASKTASVTSLLTGTGETSPTTHSTSTSTSSSSSSSSSSSDGAAVATTASSSDQTPSSNSAAVDAGIGVGVGAAALIVLGLVWFFWRRRNSKRTGTDNQQSQTSELPGRPVFELPTAIPVTEKKGELEGYNS